MRKLIRFLKRQWNRLVAFFKGRPPDKGPPLRKLQNVNVETDMAGNVRLTWTNPTERVDGVPTDGSDFEIRIGMRAVGAPNFTPIQSVQGTMPPTLLLQDQAGGDYEFQLVLFDLALDKAMPPIVQAFSIGVGDLNPITNVDVVVE